MRVDGYLRESIQLIRAIDVCAGVSEVEQFTAFEAYERLLCLLSTERSLMGDWAGVLADFLAEAEHWVDSAGSRKFSWERVAYFFDAWLAGLRPPPRCHAPSASNSEMRCLEYAS